MFRQPLEAEPGTRYAYSDLNLITLGALVERLSGMPLDAFVKKHITDPLGMTDTMYNPPASLKPRIAATEYQPEIGRGLIWGEVHDENAWSLDGVAGHAGVFSTARDLAVFGHMFLQKGKYGDKRILKESTVELMAKYHLPDFPGDDHGLGWELNQSWYMDALADAENHGTHRLHRHLPGGGSEKPNHRHPVDQPGSPHPRQRFAQSDTPASGPLGRRCHPCLGLGKKEPGSPVTGMSWTDP